MTARACSALADLVTAKEVSALKSCEPPMPASMICPVPCSVTPPPAARASAATNRNAAATNAPGDIEMTPAPSPATVTENRVTVPLQRMIR